MPTSSFQTARTNFMSGPDSVLSDASQRCVIASAAKQSLFRSWIASWRLLPAMTIRWTPDHLGERRSGRGATSLRATLALAWPLVLANLTQQAINATDVLLMGRLGPHQLAATTLALNLTYTFNMFLLGLLTAASPMMASALGQRSNAVRDVRPDLSRRACGCSASRCRSTGWCCGTSARSCACSARSGAAAMGQTSCAPICGAPRRGCCSSCCAISSSAMERPRIVLWLSLAGIALNALLSWALIFGKFGMPALGVARRRARQLA